MVELVEGLFELLGWLLQIAAAMSDLIDFVDVLGMIVNAAMDGLGWLARRWASSGSREDDRGGPAQGHSFLARSSAWPKPESE